jgi:hypothetical protein
MDTTVVATAAIGAIAGLGGGLGGAMIAARHQQLTERSRQRERAAEVFGAMGPLLTELHPGRIYMNLPPDPQPGQPDPITETLKTLDHRSRTVREQLSTLAAWWPTSEGSDLAQRLQVALFNTVIWDRHLVRAARNRDPGRTLRQALTEWNEAQSAADALRAEIRGQPVLIRPAPRVGPGVLWYGRVGPDLLGRPADRAEGASPSGQARPV